MISYKGGNGFNQQESIIILGAKNEAEGVDAEYDYLDSKYGEYELVSQEFIGEADKQYDLLRIQLPDDTRKAVWFDITDFYGKEDDE